MRPDLDIPPHSSESTLKVGLAEGTARLAEGIAALAESIAALAESIAVLAEGIAALTLRAAPGLLLLELAAKVDDSPFASMSPPQP